mmetsp:Transcript_5690/g.15990  ORF Transcript_5690/g.15990 Transcript_5690/m.15990 type:complete len:220 (+) Transcript_5690:1149-1808(+)
MSKVLCRFISVQRDLVEPIIFVFKPDFFTLPVLQKFDCINVDITRAIDAYFRHRWQLLLDFARYNRSLDIDIVSLDLDCYSIIRHCLDQSREGPLLLLPFRKLVGSIFASSCGSTSINSIVLIDRKAQELGIDNVQQNSGDESKDDHGNASNEDGGKRADPLMLRWLLSAVVKSLASILEDGVYANYEEDTDCWMGECQHQNEQLEHNEPKVGFRCPLL